MVDKEQFLVRQCCFMHGDGEQCRVPIYDVLASVAVCENHQNAVSFTILESLKRNLTFLHFQPVHQLFDPNSKPKKYQIARKRTKQSPMIRPLKRSGKNQKRKLTVPAKPSIPAHRPTMIIHPNDIQKQSAVKIQPQQLHHHQQLPQRQEIVADNNQFIHQNSGNVFASSQSTFSESHHMTDLIQQDLMTICENSYESSEDTGVGGLSESELISHDVIGSFDMESCAELTKVLSSLPTNTLDDLLTGEFV